MLSGAFRKVTTMASFRAGLVRVVDGDTSDHLLTETLIASLYSTLTASTVEIVEHVIRPKDRVRYLACWAPERNTAEGKLSTARVEKWFADHTHYKQDGTPIPDTIVVQSDGTRETFCRLLGLVVCRYCPEVLNEVLVREGYATVEKSKLHQQVLERLIRDERTVWPAAKLLRHEMETMPGEWRDD